MSIDGLAAKIAAEYSCCFEKLKLGTSFLNCFVFTFVSVYGIPDGEEMGFLIGHQHLVYDIHWSNDDQKVVTSSGDGTAQ